MGVVLRELRPGFILHRSRTTSVRELQVPQICACSNEAAGAVEMEVSLAVGTAPHNCHGLDWALNSSCWGEKNTSFPVLKEISELISVKRIRLWAVQMYVSTLSVSATNPSCRAGSPYCLT